MALRNIFLIPVITSDHTRKMKLLSIFFLLTFLPFLGCSESSEPDVSVKTLNPIVAADEVVVDEYAAYEALAEKAQPHAEKYLTLKETDPEGALSALKQGLRILYEDHPNTDAYAELLFLMDTAGEATHPQLLALSELVLEMSMDNGYPKEVIDHLRALIKETQAEIDALKTADIDPDTFTVDFEFDPTR